MSTIFPKWTNYLPQVATALAIVVPVTVVSLIWYYFSPQYTDVGYQPVQPVPFSHQLHAGQLAMDCRYCHSTVEKADYAAIPPTQTCMGCHSMVLPNSPRLALIRDNHKADKPVPWVKVHMLPDYAHFSHKAHVGAGVGCVSCHGRIDQMAVVAQEKPLSMGWCLECHRNPTPNLRPVSEVTNMAWDPLKESYNPQTDPHRTRGVNPPQHCSGCHY